MVIGGGLRLMKLMVKEKKATANLLILRLQDRGIKCMTAKETNNNYMGADPGLAIPAL
jgi:hypothetical protein